jgi:Fe-S cluster assembly scaffold IscU
MHYSKNVLEHFHHPRNVGSLDKSSPRVGTGIVGAADCGDVIKLQIEVDGGGRIVDARFKAFGCASAIAAGSFTTEWLKGRSVERVGELRDTYIAEQLSLPPVKLHCSVLADRAAKAAVEDWRRKQGPR